MNRVCNFCKADLDFLKKSKKAKTCNAQCKNKYRAVKNPKLSTSAGRKYRTTSYGKATMLYHASVVHAKKMNLLHDHEITPKWIQEKINHGFCEVTGIKLELIEKSRHPWMPSIDKIDPEKGYTIENSRIVVWIYNAAKNIFTDNDVMMMANALVNKPKK